MRIRRKPWARSELAACEFFVDNPILNKNKWNDCFSIKQPICLELGCGKGSFIAKLASSKPEINFIAVDIKSEVLVLAKRNIEKQYKSENKDINNVLLTAYNIEQINNILGEEDLVDKIYINFCNPWPKKKHQKRRLTYPKQLLNYKQFLNKNGEILFKTDDDDLFEDTIEYMNNNGFLITYITRDLHNSDYTENITTEHEKMFSEQGINIKFLIAKLK